ncbi:MAG: biliverdin-producing heme oxygenase [Rhizobiaceae bacterium]|nr:biliverdin-producing heme oxygenase [Rhizobiaceae bacterium]
MEARLSAFNTWRCTDLASLVAQDLVDLDTPALPSATFAGIDQCEGRQLGMAYVLEGSGLGARILLKRAAELGMSAVYGARHLAAQTDDPARWRSFMALLDTVPESQFDGVLAGAELSFQFALSIYAES